MKTKTPSTEPLFDIKMTVKATHLGAIIAFLDKKTEAFDVHLVKEVSSAKNLPRGAFLSSTCTFQYAWLTMARLPLLQSDMIGQRLKGSMTLGLMTVALSNGSWSVVRRWSLTIRRENDTPDKTPSQ